MAAKRKHQGDKKRCARCGEFKPLQEFPPNRALADGRAAYCRPCKRDSSKAKPAEPPREKPSASKPKNLTPEKKREKRGPPSTITPELIEEICEPLRRGHTRRAAARKAGVLEDTLAQWMKRGSEDKSGPTTDLYRAVIEAEGEGEHSLLEIVRAGADIDPQQAKWILERRYSQGAETWVRKEHIDVSTGPEMPEVSVVRELIIAKLRGLGGGSPPPAPNPSSGGGHGAGAPASDDRPGEPPPASPASGTPA